MAISPKRGLRSILSRKTSSYAHLEDENDVGPIPAPIQAAKEPTKTAIEQKPITVNVKNGNGVDRIIVCNSNSNNYTVDEEEKESEVDVYMVTRTAAIELVRNATNMTDMVATQLALASSSSFASVMKLSALDDNIVADGTSRETNAFGEKEEEKTEDADVPLGEPPIVESSFAEWPIGEPSVAETDTKSNDSMAQSAWKYGNDLVESSRESVHNALQTTQTRANDAFEASIVSGKGMMASTEAGSQACMVERLPLSPVLERASDRLESVVAQAVEEIHEFFLDHYNMLQNLKSSKTSNNNGIDNVRAESPPPSTCVELQTKDTNAK